jgi:hypothetical protein
MNKFTRWQRMTVFKGLLQAFDDPDGGDDKGGSGADDKGKDKGTDTGKDKSKDGDKGKDQGADEKKYSDADLDRIINQKFAKWQKDQDKAVSEAEKLAKMDAQQKAEYERDQLQKRVAELEKKENRAEMGKVARGMLNEDGINIPDDLVNMIITTDAESTKTNVQQFSKLFKAAVQDAVKEALKGKTPGTGSSSGTVTKEQIMKIKDRTERQRMIQKHRDLFK